MALGPAREELHALPDDLRAFLTSLASKLEADPDLLAHDAENAFADRLDQGTIEITYLTSDDWKWTFTVAPSAVAALGAEASQLSLWVCGDAACGYRFGTDAGRCPRCDETADAGKTERGLGRLLADLFGEAGVSAEAPVRAAAPPKPKPSSKPPASGADRLLMMLVQQGQVELVPGADKRALAAGIDGFLAEGRPAEAQAEQLIGWLLDQDAVDEVYVSDDDLSRILEAW